MLNHDRPRSSPMNKSPSQLMVRNVQDPGEAIAANSTAALASTIGRCARGAALSRRSLMSSPHALPARGQDRIGSDRDPRASTVQPLRRMDTATAWSAQGFQPVVQGSRRIGPTRTESDWVRDTSIFNCHGHRSGDLRSAVRGLSDLKTPAGTESRPILALAKTGHRGGRAPRLLGGATTDSKVTRSGFHRCVSITC